MLLAQLFVSMIGFAALPATSATIHLALLRTPLTSSGKYRETALLENASLIYILFDRG